MTAVITTNQSNSNLLSLVAVWFRFWAEVADIGRWTTEVSDGGMLQADGILQVLKPLLQPSVIFQHLLMMRAFHVKLSVQHSCCLLHFTADQLCKHARQFKQQDA